jgi:hypothetical protein
MFLVVALIFATNLAAQDKEDQGNKNKNGKLEQGDRIVVDLFTDLWQKLPSSSQMSTTWFNRGINVYGMRDLPLGKTNFSIGLGAGISCHNLYSDGIIAREVDTNLTYTGKMVFQKIPSKSVTGTDVSYKVNKLTVVYVDIPVEFRFRTKNSQFKFAVGAKGGMMLGSHSKYSGDDFSNPIDPTINIKEKQNGIPNIMGYHYGALARVGWKYVSLSAFYSLTPLFKKDKGPEMYPISVGITITPM